MAGNGRMPSVLHQCNTGNFVQTDLERFFMWTIVYERSNVVMETILGVTKGNMLKHHTIFCSFVNLGIQNEFNLAEIWLETRCNKSYAL